MSEPHEDTGRSPERIEQLMRAARVARARDIRAALGGVLRRLRGLLSAKPECGPKPRPAAC
jgi:hypothetical protein